MFHFGCHCSEHNTSIVASTDKVVMLECVMVMSPLVEWHRKYIHEATRYIYNAGFCYWDLKNSLIFLRRPKFRLDAVPYFWSGWYFILRWGGGGIKLCSVSLLLVWWNRALQDAGKSRGRIVAKIKFPDISLTFPWPKILFPNRINSSVASTFTGSMHTHID